MRTGLFTSTESDAIFSEDAAQLYRYVLMRVWGTGPRVCCVMLNPSKAGKTANDPTTLKSRQIFQSLGFGGMYFVNEFGYRTSSPDVLRAVAAEGAIDVVGPLNDKFILDFATRADKVVCAWGMNGTLLNRHQAVFSLLRGAGIQPYCLDRTSNGQPNHPLWCKSRTLQPLMVV